MTRKHFEAIAARIREQRAAYPPGSVEDRAMAALVNSLADEFHNFNPNFDGYRFIEACVPKGE